MNDFALALKRQPVAALKIRNVEILASAANRLAEVAVIDVADPIPVIINKQQGLVKVTTLGCAASVRDVGGIVQIPCVGRAVKKVIANDSFDSISVEIR